MYIVNHKSLYQISARVQFDVNDNLCCVVCVCYFGCPQSAVAYHHIALFPGPTYFFTQAEKIFIYFEENEILRLSYFLYMEDRFIYSKTQNFSNFCDCRKVKKSFKQINTFRLKLSIDLPTLILVDALSDYGAAVFLIDQ